MSTLFIAYYQADWRIRAWAWLLGHDYELHHVSLIQNDCIDLIEWELTHEGRAMYQFSSFNSEALSDVSHLSMVGWTSEPHPDELAPTLRMSWRSLLRSGVEYTLPPWSSWLARAILRVCGDDPTPITCSGYVYHRLTGRTDPHLLLLPPHLLAPLLELHTYDLPRS